MSGALATTPTPFPPHRETQCSDELGPAIDLSEMIVTLLQLGFDRVATGGTFKITEVGGRKMLTMHSSAVFIFGRGESDEFIATYISTEPRFRFFGCTCRVSSKSALIDFLIEHRTPELNKPFRPLVSMGS